MLGILMPKSLTTFSKINTISAIYAHTISCHFNRNPSFAYRRWSFTYVEALRFHARREMKLITPFFSIENSTESVSTSAICAIVENTPVTILNANEPMFVA